MPRPRKPANPFRYFHSSPEVIRLAVLMYVRFPLSLRNVEDLLFERGIDMCYETVRLWWNRFGPMFAADIRRQRVNHGAGEYVRGTAHTNTVEGYFSIFKRGVIGTYYHMSAKHLHRYCVEFDFRYNTRKGNDFERCELALKGITGKRLTYRRAGQLAA